MTKQQLSAAIRDLIRARDEDGADTQKEIDELFMQFEGLCNFAVPAAEQAAHASAVERMG